MSVRATFAGRPPAVSRGMAVTWSGALRAGGVIGLAAGLPFVVTSRWYDFYYWPKIVVLYAVVGLLTLAALLTDRDRWLRTWRSPVGSALAAWLAVLAASTLLSVNPLLSLVGEDYRYEGLLTWLAYGGLVALAACALTTTRRLSAFVPTLLVAGVVMAILGLLQRWGWTPVPEDVLRADLVRAIPRAWGTTGNPLALGAYLVLLLPVAISLYVWETDVGRRCLYGAVAVLFYAALVATLARAAWGALAVGLAVWGVATGLRRLRAAAGLLILLGALLAVVTPAVLIRGPAGAAGPATVHVSSPGTGAQRMFLWRTVTPLVWRRPLLGWGPETLAEIYPAYQDPEFPQVFPEARMQHLIIDRPHNDLLQQAVSTGLLGLAVYVWLWLTMLRTAWQVARRERRRAVVASASVTVLPPSAGGVRSLSGGARSLSGGGGLGEARFGAALASGLVGGLAAYFAQLQFSFNYVSVAPVFWILVGALLALARDPAAHPPR